jgi:hypothetical protein
MRESEFGSSEPTKARHDNMHLEYPCTYGEMQGRHRRHHRTLGQLAWGMKRCKKKKKILFSNKEKVKTETQAYSLVSTYSMCLHE